MSTKREIVMSDNSEIDLGAEAAAAIAAAAADGQPTKPVAAKRVRQPAAKKTAPRERHVIEIDMSSGSVPKLIIIGRGQLNNRKLYACRLRPESIDRLRKVASGPDYLLIDLAVNRLCDVLERQENSEVIRAEELG